MIQPESSQTLYLHSLIYINIQYIHYILYYICIHTVYTLMRQNFGKGSLNLQKM